MFACCLIVALLSARPEGHEGGKATDTTQVEKAKSLFAWAKRLYQQARYAEAIAKFQEAYSVLPSPVFFYNIGRCWEALGETARAMRAYKEYLRAAPEASDRELVTDAIANLERRLDEKGLQQLMVFVEPDTATISVDGTVLGSSPASVELGSGNHQLSVSAEGYERVERSFVMSAARSSEISLTLRRRSPDEASTSTSTSTSISSSTSPEAPPPVASDEPRTPVLVPRPPKEPGVGLPVPPRPPPARRTAAWVLGGVAIAGGVAGVAMGSVAADKAAQVRSGRYVQPELETVYRQASTLSTAANVSYAVAGAAALTAGILFLVDR